MKLSEAIRLGAVMTKQCYGPFIEERQVVLTRLMGQVIDERVECATCAMGGALAAVGLWKRLQRETHDVCPAEVFPILNVVVEYPVGLRRVWGTQHSVFLIIAHLNDRLQWSREDIADWVRSLEARLPESITEARLPEDEEEVPEADVVLAAALA